MSIDYSLKTYVSDKEVGSSWGAPGCALLEIMNAGSVEQILGLASASRCFPFS